MKANKTPNPGLFEFSTRQSTGRYLDAVSFAAVPVDAYRGGKYGVGRRKITNRLFVDTGIVYGTDGHRLHGALIDDTPNGTYILLAKSKNRVLLFREFDYINF